MWGGRAVEQTISMCVSELGDADGTGIAAGGFHLV